MIQVQMRDKIVYHLMATLEDFALWVDGASNGERTHDDFRAWVRKDGSRIYLDRCSVMAAMHLKPKED
jgi:hypothetical protein